VPFRNRPLAAAAAGATCIASSATLVRLADVAPATAAAYRCVYALPMLGLLAWWEGRRGQPIRDVGWVAASAGVFFALDLVLWHHAIAAVGAGLATVLGNLQVVLVGFFAWWLLGERPSGRLIAAVPIVIVGVVLITGVIGSGAYGDNPVLGVLFGIATSFAYAAFILVFRHGSGNGRTAGPLFRATLVAGIVSVAVGPFAGGIDLAPHWPAHGWLVLLALAAQVAGWLLIGFSLSRLPAAVASLMLLLQPMLAMLLSAAVLAERPSTTQLVGCAVVLAGVLLGAGGERRRPAVPRSEVLPEHTGDSAVDVEVGAFGAVGHSGVRLLQKREERSRWGFKQRRSIG
jgi:drug/metabolite transporter (DMT)-like permease